MTERIYQLRESEYNELFEKAKLNDKEIKEFAEKYYQERGIFKITIDTSIRQKNEDTCQGSIATFDVNSYCFENGLCKRDSLNPLLSERDRRRVNQMVANICEDTFYEYYGDVIKCRDKISNIFLKLQYFKFILYMIAFSGWGVATAVILYHFLFSK
ncbi:hypothetical protein [Prevotella melaninogenica]|uniref:hypothetical protein n=1 Tax=Prevotella melaninogenica TaxID=28132 RepID=UPI001BA5E66E|nr:hypothetical protein [Prevotella melaninogenica]QUB64912.1 hypothetical protein J5A57_04910 [Prevotella melaninogenica]